MPGGGAAPGNSIVAWCSDSATIRASGSSITRPKPVAQPGRSAPRILLPASVTAVRPRACTTVVTADSAMSSSVQTSSSNCCASLKG
ncbi:Uncharacterised protein [Mycobacteroides abscessus subsp. abscessus]|nr:Uncharacterised protein [Mycobacteroides abscessus subsp. abscessus]